MAKYVLYGALSGLRGGVFDTEALTWTYSGYFGLYSACALSFDGAYLFARTGTSLETFSVNQTTGALTALALYSVGFNVNFASSPTVRALYSHQSSAVYMATYDSSGVVSSQSLAASPSPGTVVGVVMSRDGKWLYALINNASVGNYACYAVNQATGALTPSSSGLCPLPSLPYTGAVIGAKFAYFASGAAITQFSVNPSTGALTALSPSTVSTSAPSVNIDKSRDDTFDVSGGAPSTGSYSGYDIFTCDSSGRLTLSQSVSTGTDANGVGYITPDGRMFYCACASPFTDYMFSYVSGVANRVSAASQLSQPLSLAGTRLAESGAVTGCMDPTAQNYNSAATQDTSPSSCVYGVGGLTGDPLNCSTVLTWTDNRH